MDFVAPDEDEDKLEENRVCFILTKDQTIKPTSDITNHLTIALLSIDNNYGQTSPIDFNGITYRKSIVIRYRTTIEKYVTSLIYGRHSDSYCQLSSLSVRHNKNITSFVKFITKEQNTNYTHFCN